jgi:hypothetical protein
VLAALFSDRRPKQKRHQMLLVYITFTPEAKVAKQVKYIVIKVSHLYIRAECLMKTSATIILHEMFVVLLRFF